MSTPSSGVLLFEHGFDRYPYRRICTAGASGEYLWTLIEIEQQRLLRIGSSETAFRDGFSPDGFGTAEFYARGEYER